MEENIIQNSITWLEIIDSSIKIGLGAFIGVFGSYLTIKMNYKNELSKKKLDKKMVMFEESIKIIDNYLSCMGELTKEWNKYEIKNIFLKDLSPNEQEKYKILDESFIESKQESAKAAMYLRILGLDKLLETIQKIDAIFNPVRAVIKLNEAPFVTQPTLKELYKDINDLVKSFHYETKEAFNSLS